MSSNAQAVKAFPPRSPRQVERAARIEYGDPVYFKVMDFLIQEALLLDENQLEQWRALLDDDIFYYMPHRRTLERDAQRFDEGTYWLYENMPTIELRIRKLLTAPSAFAENPPSRFRRFVTNLTLFKTGNAQEYVALSYLLLTRNRGDQAQYQLISCVREDILRCREGRWSIAQRNIMVDQSVLGVHNISYFL